MGRLMSTLCPASHCVQNCPCLSGEKKTQPCPMAEKGETEQKKRCGKNLGEDMYMNEWRRADDKKKGERKAADCPFFIHCFKEDL